jgi:class 3 adenylate cyclase/tetratricopeptide (TPR) repeat protein
MPLCASCGQDNPDIARFCLACGAAVAEPERPPGEERKLVTGVFVDVVGSTARAEQLDPEDVRAMLGPYHSRVRAELERFGGTVEKFIGDAVFALFGAPVAHEDDPERAVRAGFALLDGVGELNANDEWLDLHVRVGVHTGEALVMLDAKPGEGDWMAAGDIVNTAARIQSAAPTDGVLVGELTYRATRNVIEYEQAEPISAKGKTEPVPVWVARNVRERVARPTARVPLLGREAELGELLALWREARSAQRPRLATIVGAPGIGKSRLLAELAQRVEQEGTVHWGRCLPYGEGITYWPVIDLLKSAAGILQSDSAATISAKLGALLDRLPTDDLDQLRTMAAAVSNLAGVEMTPRGTYSAAQITQAELHWGVRRLFQLLAGERPLVLVFEDLHWAEPTLLELISYLTEDEADGPFLIVCTTRPELAEADPGFLAGDGRRRTIELDALPADAGEALLERLLGTGLAEGPAAASLLHTAGGNPLFLEEMVQMFRDAGLVDSEGWHVDVDGGELPVPTSLQALIGSRLDQLPGGQKRIAQHASVVGTVFWPSAVAHLDGNAARDGELAGGLDELERRDLVHRNEASSVAGELEYAFKHILIRDVAYAQLPKGRRAHLHVRFAEWTSALPGSEDEFVEIVAYHLEQACLLSREVAHSPIEPPVLEAAGALARAGEKAERREGIREADRFYARALEVAGDEYPEMAAELRLRRGRTLTGVGELGRAADLLLHVAEETVALRRLDLRAETLVGLANIDYKQGAVESAHRHIVEAESIASQIGDRRLQVRAAYEFAQLRADFEGAREAALKDLERALAIAEELDNRALRIEGHLRMGALLFNLGRLAEAEEHLLRCSALAGEGGSRRDEARAAANLAFVKFYRGDHVGAERIALQAREWLERTSDTFFRVQTAWALAVHALARDDIALAEDRLREAIPLALEMGGWIVVPIYRHLIDALVRQERVRDAADLLAFAERGVPEEDVYARATLLQAQAVVAAAEGRSGEARDALEEALRLLEEQEWPIDVAEVHLALARALVQCGDVSEARRQLDQARELSARMDAKGLLAEIDSELAGKAAPAGPTGR